MPIDYGSSSDRSGQSNGSSSHQREQSNHQSTKSIELKVNDIEFDLEGGNQISDQFTFDRAQESNKQYTLKIMVAGAAEVGKSTFIDQIHNLPFE